MDTAEEAPAVQATPAATIADVTPGRRPFGTLNANTRAVGSTVYAVNPPAKPAPSKDSALERLPIAAPSGKDNCSKTWNEAQTTTAAPAVPGAAAAPYCGGLLASTQPEQPAGLAARTSRRSTRSKEGAAAGAGPVAGEAAGFAVLPGRFGADRQLQGGLFAAAAAVSSPAPAMAGRTPTRLMR
jgi:hypothetical protein